jgi:hypothetical protein
MNHEAFFGAPEKRHGLERIKQSLLLLLQGFILLGRSVTICFQPFQYILVCRWPRLLKSGIRGKFSGISCARLIIVDENFPGPSPPATAGAALTANSSICRASSVMPPQANFYTSTRVQVAGYPSKYSALSHAHLLACDEP